MAGARQGWVEAGYIDTPEHFARVLERAVRAPGQTRDIRILPGLRSEVSLTSLGWATPSCSRCPGRRCGGWRARLARAPIRNGSG
jgi:hypothetical protein